MKTLYIDCGMGAAGDMLSAALLELFDDREALVAELNAMGIPSVRYEAQPSVKCGITGTHMSVLVDGAEEEPAEDVHDHDHEHHHEDGHDHEHEHGHDHDHEHEHDYEHDDYDHDDHEHSHDHEHEHDHDHGHAHDHEHHHHHSGMADIECIIGGLNASDEVKKDALEVYQLIAEAEGSVHGAPVSEVHFHEVGTMDAVADVMAVCLLMHRLAPQQVVASPVNTGSGHVRCAHGILPVPAPATALILQGMPIYSNQIEGELCTPTGAALLKHFVTSFGSMPVMTPTAYGYGMGRKDFEVANCVRAVLGETEEAAEQVIDLSCNVDDMTAEELGFAMDRLFEAGALDAFTAPIGMKKSRPGTLLHVLCRKQDVEKVARAVFKHTTTIGVRSVTCDRYVLDRSFDTLETPYGSVQRKDSTGYGVARSKLEYDDLAAIAIERGISLFEARKLVDGE